MDQDTQASPGVHISASVRQHQAEIIAAALLLLEGAPETISCVLGRQFNFTEEQAADMVRQARLRHRRLLPSKVTATVRR